MPAPKALTISDGDVHLMIQHTKSRRNLYLSAYSCPNHATARMSLADFFERLGITEDECRHVWRELTKRDQ